MNYFRDGVYSANYDMPSLSKNFSMLSGDFIFRFTYPDRITDKIGNIYAKTEVKCWTTLGLPSILKEDVDP